MKKLFSTMIALAMLAATPLTVFATGSSSNTGGNTEIDVNGKYIEGNAATMISVDITWDDMSFEYNDGEIRTSMNTSLPADHGRTRRKP